jgi:GTPase Era involved in 16S rRNA processing
MNEKIKQLLDKAEVYYNDDMYSDYNDLASLQKFAELIVRECAEYITEYFPHSQYEARQLKKHFGVSE